jgi:hypothetical protein
MSAGPSLTPGRLDAVPRPQLVRLYVSARPSWRVCGSLDGQADLRPGRAGYQRLRPVVLLDRTAVAKDSPRVGQDDELLEPGNDLRMGNAQRSA